MMPVKWKILRKLRVLFWRWRKESQYSEEEAFTPEEIAAIKAQLGGELLCYNSIGEAVSVWPY